MNEKMPLLSDRAATGVEGLDDILGGGLPRGHLYLVLGEAGTGKTTLGLQFVLQGQQSGEKVLYITLAETERELNEIAASHGWSLNGVHIHELTTTEAAEYLAKSQTIFPVAEVELNEVTDKILAAIDHIQPDRVVFDSISEIRLLAEDSLRYRRQILALRQLLSDLGCTTLFINSTPVLDGERTLHSLVHGIIELERKTPGYGSVRRQLQVAKLRATDFHAGYHDFRIRRGGVIVYPRVKVESERSGTNWENISSGVAEIDALLGGGLELGTACLITGPSGAGKSTVATLYVYSAAKRGEKSAVFIFDERLDTFFQRSEGIGMDFRPYVEQGVVTVRQINTDDISPGEFVQGVLQSVADGARIVVIDSLTGYVNIVPHERELLTQLHELLTNLGQRGVLTFLIIAQHGVIEDGRTVAPIEASYLADAIILLRHFEARGAVRQAISVIKQRNGRHEKTIRELRITPNGVEVSEPLAAFSGVLSGVPKYEGEPRGLIDNHDLEEK